jgi:hypothetical protein
MGIIGSHVAQAIEIENRRKKDYEIPIKSHQHPIVYTLVNFNHWVKYMVRLTFGLNFG